MDSTLDAFIERLIEERKVGGVPHDVLRQMKADLHERLLRLINAEILANMPEYALVDFEKTLDTGSQEKIQQFCSEKIPNLTAVVSQALVDFRNVYLTGSRTQLV